MKIVICDMCSDAMVYCMKDVDGVNLEEVYECECGNCVGYDNAENSFVLEEGDEVGYHGRQGTLKEIKKYFSLVYFQDIDSFEELQNSEIAKQNS